MPTALAIAALGAAGALLRYGLDRAVTRRTDTSFPVGILLVNVSGAFAIGLVVSLLAERHVGSPWLRTGLSVGLLGAFTTFSTLSLDTYRLVQEGSFGLALANSVGSLGAGLLAVWAGLSLGRAF